MTTEEIKKEEVVQETITPKEKIKNVFSLDKKNYKIELPATSIKVDGAWIPYTAEEVIEDKKLQKTFVDLLEKGETKFIIEI